MNLPSDVASPWAFWSRPLARQIDGDLSSS